LLPDDQITICLMAVRLFLDIVIMQYHLFVKIEFVTLETAANIIRDEFVTIKTPDNIIRDEFLIFVTKDNLRYHPEHMY